jgi:beta-galactosidase
MQCDVGLACTALVECPVQDGLLMLCQALVGSKLDADPVAGRLFDNLLAHALAYGREARPTAAVVEPDSPKQKLLTESGLAYRLLDDPVRAVASGRFGIVIVDATPDNLASLAARADAVDAFTESGGWLMLWGVTPEGLEAFNSLVGAQHLMRPFRQERVYLRSPRDPLVAGLSQRDVAMSTGRKYMRFMETEIPSDDAFTFVVDYTDVAPFAEWPEPEYFKHFDEDPLNSGHHPLNMVNGMTRRDFWRFIFYLHLFDDPPTEWTIELPRREEVAGLAIIPNPTYHHLETLRLAFDGREEDAVTLELEEHGEGPPKRQEFDFTPRPAKTVTFDLVEWEEVGSQDVLGIDNLWITAQRSDEFLRKVKPLLNIGALVRYPQGKGGIVLNQVNTLESEANPVNAEKKKAIVSTMLRNMGAAFGREGVLRPGERFNYRPVPLGTACNLYLSSEWGWPDEQYDLSGLPLGRQKLHGIAYKIRDFETSPLESAVTLSGMPGVEAPASVVIPVETTADALFFLHTFHARPTWRDGPEAEGNPVVFQYVVHYADGEQATVDVAYGEGTGNWISPDPADLPEAGLAWSAPLPGEGAERAAVYQLRWDNQRPDARIDALELRYPAEGGEKRGAPVLLGVTAADAVE